MLDGIFEIESEEIDELCSYYNKTSQEINDANQEAKRDFEPLKRAEVFGRGAQKINNQLDLFSDKFIMLSNALQKSMSKTFEEEYHFRDEIRSLQIPKDFGVNDSSHSNSFENVTLVKNDGRSVNEGKALFDNTEEFASSVKYNTNLQDFNNNGGKENQNINFKLNGNETRLEDITSKNLENQELNFRLDGKEKNLQNIDSESLNEQKIDFNLNGGNVNISNINSSQSIKQENIEFDDDDIEVLED